MSEEVSNDTVQYQKIKFMDPKEFRTFGYLQEINRQFLHPVGLALEIRIDEETGEETLGKIWDYRDDPEGIWFDFKSWPEGYNDGTPNPQDKAANVMQARAKFFTSRCQLFAKVYGEEHFDFEVEPVKWQVAEPSNV
jgi:hypothetical protein